MTTTELIEAGRLAFLEARGGPADARDFAALALRQYRAAVKRGKDGRRTPYGTVYRRTLILSCLAFRAYLRQSAT